MHLKGLRAPGHRRRACGLGGAVVKVAAHGRGTPTERGDMAAGVAGKALRWRFTGGLCT